MHKTVLNVTDVKNDILSLKGKNLNISVNKGRKRIVKYAGAIENVYPSVFTLKIFNEKNIDTLSFSYSDVICGDIRFTAAHA